MLYYAGLTAFRRWTRQQQQQQQQQHQLVARAGIPVGNDLRRTSSDSALFSDSFSSLNSFSDDDHLSIPIPYNSSYSNPSTPTSNARHPFNDDEESPLFININSNNSDSSGESKTDVGLGLLNTFQVHDNDAVARTMAPFSHQRGILLGHQVLKLASKTPIRVTPKIITDLENPIHCIHREIHPDGEMVTRIRQNWPCIFAPVMEPASPPPIRYSNMVVQPDSVQLSDCRSHAIVNPEGTVAYFRPLTFCSVHKNAGYLRLEDVEKSENYTRVEAIYLAKVTHRFNSCVLEFPPAEKLIFFKKDKDLRDLDEEHQKARLNKNSPNADNDSKVPKPPAPKKKMEEDDNHEDEAGPSSRAKPQLKLCEECGKCIDDLDWFLYRSLVFCSEDCRYSNTKDSVLLSNSVVVVENGGNPRSPKNNGGRNRRAATNGGNNARGVVSSGGSGNPRAPNNNGNARVTVNGGGAGGNSRGSNNRGNARGIVTGGGHGGIPRGPNNSGGNARGVVANVSGGGYPRGPNNGRNARGIVIVSSDYARGRGGDQNQNPNQATQATSSSSKNDKGKGILYIG